MSRDTKGSKGSRARSFLVVPDKITHPRDEIQNAREQKEAGYKGGKKGTLWREETPMKNERKAEERGC